MRRAHEELGFRHVRFHGLLCNDVGTLISEGDTLFYSFFNADQIFDFLLSIGMRPFVELSFMPTTLASGAQTVFHYRQRLSPKDYAHWSTLIRKLVVHWVERYGLTEVREWFFEVWNAKVALIERSLIGGDCLLHVFPTRKATSAGAENRSRCCWGGAKSI